MTNTKDTVHASQSIISEGSQELNTRVSRASFFKVATMSALGAAGTLMSLTQPTLAASSTSQIPKGRNIASGIYYIQSALTGFVLDIPNSNRAAGTFVSVYPQNSPLTYNQLWFVSEDGYIQSLLDGFVLDVYGSNKSPTAPIIVYPKNNPPSPNQHWFVSNGYIYSGLDGFVLDVSGGNTAAGASIIVFPKNTPLSLNQQWTLKPAF
jgi:hypothetical protein